MQHLREYASYIAFLLATFALDAAFFATRLRQVVRGLLGFSSLNFEDELEKTMRGFAKSNFGVDISDSAFSG